MQKQLLFLSLLLSFGSAVLWAATPPQKTEGEESAGAKNQIRSVVFSPQTTFYADQSMLEIRFYSEQHFIVKVVDASGTTIFMSQLITDGATHSYMLPSLQSGFYRLTLESLSKDYEGSILAI